MLWQVPWKNRSEMNSSPLVVNGAVYVATPDVTAYNAETGRLLWQTPVGGSGYGGAKFSVVLWTSGGKSYLVGISGAYLYCVEPDTGKMLWKVAGVGSGEGSSSPAISGDIAAFYGIGGVYAFKLSPQKAEQLWKTPPACWRGDSLIIYQDSVYVGSTNPLRCMDLKTGEVKWENKQIANMYSSPILADGKILYPFGHGWSSLFMVMFKATPEKFEELGRFPKEGEKGIVTSCSSPAIANGKLYLRLSGKDYCVACYDLTDAGAK
jgi:outer membrane protein assembly factor BamB